MLTLGRSGPGYVETRHIVGPAAGICTLSLPLVSEITSIMRNKEQNWERSSSFSTFKLFPIFLYRLVCLVIKANTETSVVPEDKLPGEMHGRDVKRIKFEINKTHLEERNELPSTKGQSQVDVASSNWWRA